MTHWNAWEVRLGLWGRLRLRPAPLWRKTKEADPRLLIKAILEEAEAVTVMRPRLHPWAVYRATRRWRRDALYLVVLEWSTSSPPELILAQDLRELLPLLERLAALGAALAEPDSQAAAVIHLAEARSKLGEIVERLGALGAPGKTTRAPMARKGTR